MSRFLSISQLHQGQRSTTTAARAGISLAGVSLAGFFVMTAPSWAESVHLTASLSGAKEVPPNDSKGTGTMTGTYDTMTGKLTWQVTYSGLSGPVTAAHFHGPAPADKNAGVLVPLPHVKKSPIKGSAVLNKAQAKDLLAGEVYVNIHTKAHPAGAIRGQVEKMKK